MNIKKIPKIYYFYFSLIILFFVTRCLFLLSIPSGMHTDEMAMTYNVWCLDKFGTDRYNFSYPIYFQNITSGQSCIFIYLGLLVYKLPFISQPELALRIVAVIFNAIFCFFTIKLLKQYSVLASNIAACCLIIMPYFIFTSRWALDCNAFAPFFVLMIYFLDKYIRCKKKKDLYIAAVFTSCCFYSYILAFIILPCFFFMFYMYCFVCKKLNIKDFILHMIVSGILSIPILLYILVLLGYIPEIHSFITITQASQNRVSELNFKIPSLGRGWRHFCTLLTNDENTSTTIPKYSVFYMFPSVKFSLSYILIGIGMVYSLYLGIKKKQQIWFFTWFLFLSNTILLFFINVVTIYRFNTIYFSFIVFLALGITFFIQRKWLVVVFGILLFYGINFISYTHWLFTENLTKTAVPYYDEGLYKIMEEMQGEKKDIYIDVSYIFNPTVSVLYGLRETPNVMNKCTNFDQENMAWDNIFLDLPDTTNMVDENNIYIIKKINETTIMYNSLSMDSKGRNIEKLREKTEKWTQWMAANKWKMEEKYGYYICHK